MSKKYCRVLAEALGPLMRGVICQIKPVNMPGMADIIPYTRLDGTASYFFFNNKQFDLIDSSEKLRIGDQIEVSLGDGNPTFLCTLNRPSGADWIAESAGEKLFVYYRDFGLSWFPAVVNAQAVLNLAREQVSIQKSGPSFSVLKKPVRRQHPVWRKDTGLSQLIPPDNADDEGDGLDV